MVNFRSLSYIILSVLRQSKPQLLLEMGRNKNKQRFDEDRVKMLKNEQFDEDIPDEVHNRLLESIKQFHGKPK